MTLEEPRPGALEGLQLLPEADAAVKGAGPGALDMADDGEGASGMAQQPLRQAGDENPYPELVQGPDEVSPSR